VLLVQQELRNGLHLEDGRALLGRDFLLGEENSSDEDEDDIPHEGRLVLQVRGTVQRLPVVGLELEKHSGREV